MNLNITQIDQKLQNKNSNEHRYRKRNSVLLVFTWIIQKYPRKYQKKNLKNSNSVDNLVIFIQI